ncbi:MAG: hypothetical protein JO121_10440 [Deltaproteobacteria bacterium]|nr:hypothetical protein [Deltaproteobacteria bacterium]
MSTFGRFRRLTIVGLIFVYSCGAIDGGSRGTGITSTLQGSVASVTTASNPEASVEGLSVVVQHHGAHALTNSAGAFVVQGSFDGNVTVLFRRQTDKVHARYSIYLPSGGTMTLNGVRIDNTSATATVDSANIDFVGQITQIDCVGQTLTMLAAKRPPGDTDTYTVLLNTSSLVDSQRNPVGCSQLRNGQFAHVQGTVNDDDSFGNAVIVIE